MWQVLGHRPGEEMPSGILPRDGGYFLGRMWGRFFTSTEQQVQGPGGMKCPGLNRWLHGVWCGGAQGNLPGQGWQKWAEAAGTSHKGAQAGSWSSSIS